MKHPTPTKPGWYWAKWQIPEDDTHEKDEVSWPQKGWIVVEVFENCSDPKDAEYLRVFVDGVRESQCVENFFWGTKVRGEANEQ